MRVLILNQAFWPDHVATAQYATDLAAEMAQRGHQVTVISSDRAHDSPTHRFPKSEDWQGVRIERVSTFGLGKQSVASRLLGFLAYSLGVVNRMLKLPAQDVILALTTPPLIAALGATLKRWRGGRLVFWVMDLNPDQAIAAGLLRHNSMAAKALEAVLRIVLKRSDSIVALDRFVEARLRARQCAASPIAVIPPWSLDNNVEFDRAGRDEFRRAHGLESKFIVMHSGNHSPCHPLDTVLGAARRLAHRPDIAFVFAGGGVEHRKVSAFAAEHDLSNIHCLPYQPVEKLSASLSAADLHIVALGDSFVGILHPSKIYNILKVGIPILYVGPAESHVTDLAPEGAPWLLSARHGDVAGVVNQVRTAADRGELRYVAESSVSTRFARSVLMERMIAVIEDRPSPVVLALKAGSARAGA